MQTIRGLAFLTAISLIFFSTTAFESGAFAQIQGSYQAQIAVFVSKFDTLQSTRTALDLDQRVACLDQREAQLTSQRRDKEQALGELRVQEKKLMRDIQMQQAAYDGFSKSFMSEQQKLAKLRGELGNLLNQKRAQEQWIEECKRDKPWQHLWGLACEADMNIAKTFGQVKNYEGDITAAERTEQIARDSMEFSRSKLDDSGQKLTDTRKNASDIDKEIAQTETVLVNVSKRLADIRASMQSLKIVIDEFSQVLNDAKDVNLADERSRTVRILSSIAARADETIRSSVNAVSNTDKALGQGWMTGCAKPPTAPTGLRQDSDNTRQIPADLVASAGGLDPHISSPAAAEYQVERVARARKIDPSALKALVDKYTEDCQWAVFGEPRVNVLELNIALDSLH